MMMTSDLLPQNYKKEWFDFSILQSTLGFATMDIAANLDLATARDLTDFRQCINSDIVFSDLKF